MHAERETRLAGQQREAATIRLWLSHKSLSASAKLASQPRTLGGNLDRKHGTVEARKHHPTAPPPPPTTTTTTTGGGLSLVWMHDVLVGWTSGAIGTAHASPKTQDWGDGWHKLTWRCGRGSRSRSKSRNWARPPPRLPHRHACSGAGPVPQPRPNPALTAGGEPTCARAEGRRESPGGRGGGEISHPARALCPFNSFMPRQPSKHLME